MNFGKRQKNSNKVQKNALKKGFLNFMKNNMGVRKDYTT